jgi:hypothetical protein
MQTLVIDGEFEEVSPTAHDTVDRPPHLGRPRD